MSSVTKNPIVLQSANYIYNYFISKIKENEEMVHYDLLNEIDSDKFILKYIKNKFLKMNNYKDIESRLERAKEGFYGKKI